VQHTVSELCSKLLAKGIHHLPGPRAFLDQDCVAMSSMDCPFPVEVPHAIRPDLVKLDTDAPLLILDRPIERWRVNVGLKAQRLRSASSFILTPYFTNDNLRFWASRIAKALSDRIPQGPTTHDCALPWLGLSARRDPLEFLIGLSLCLHEDFVLMAPLSCRPAAGYHSQAGADTLAARLLSVCFPSGWAPQEKCDQALFEIHTPVADNARIQKAAESMSRAMATKGPFERYVYTLSPSDSLWREPGGPAWEETRTLSEIWFRTERQITIPLDGQASLFLIRVFVRPLTDVLDSPEKAHLLAGALESMSDALIRYKGLGAVAPEIVSELRARY
jgi:hypothetical protein